MLPRWGSAPGDVRLVPTALVIKETLMINAAVVSNRLAPADATTRMCRSVVSAADKVMVMMKLVAAKAEQHQDEDLALPERHEPLQHGDRTFAIRAFGRHAPINRQCAEERQSDKCEGWGRSSRRQAPQCPVGIREWRSNREVRRTRRTFVKEPVVRHRPASDLSCDLDHL